MISGSTTAMQLLDSAAELFDKNHKSRKQIEGQLDELYRQIGQLKEDLELMRLIDEQYLKTLVFGSRSMVRHFWRQGRKVNRKRIQRLMRLMGIEAIYPKPHTSRPHPEHKMSTVGCLKRLEAVLYIFSHIGCVLNSCLRIRTFIPDPA
jgi:hypothetical protein